MNAKRNQLTAIYLAILVTISVTLAAQENDPAVISAEEIATWLEEGKSFVILDVQTPREHNEIGHPPNAINIPWYYQDPETLQTEDNENFLAMVTEKVDKDQPVVIVCSAAIRAHDAAVLLMENEFAEVYVFQDGLRGNREDRSSQELQNGWIANGLPWVGGDKTYADYLVDEQVSAVDASIIREWTENGEFFVVLDVRSPEERIEYGFIPGSLNIPLDTAQVSDPETRRMYGAMFTSEALQYLSNHTRIVTICTVSWRASVAALLLTENGFDEVQPYRHGIWGRLDGKRITDGWVRCGLPFIDKSAQE